MDRGDARLEGAGRGEPDLMGLRGLLAEDADLAMKHRGGGVVEIHYTIGRVPVRIQFAGAELAAPLAGALAHLETSTEQPPGLSITVWSGPPTSHVKLERLLADSLGVTGHSSAVHRCSQGNLTVTFDSGLTTVSLFDAGLMQGFLWVREPAEIGYHQMAGPFRSILSRALRSCGLDMIHGAGVGRNGRGLLLIGPNGSGKSTTSMICWQAGFEFVGDDNVLLGSEPQPHVHSVYGTAKLSPPQLDSFPELSSAISPVRSSETDKHLVFPWRCNASRMVRGLSLSAVLLTRVSGHPETRYERIAATRGLLAVVPHSIFALDGRHPETVARMSRALGSLPHYALHLGLHRAGVLESVEAILAKEGAR